MLKVMDIDEILENLKEQKIKLSCSEISIIDSDGMTLAEDIISPCNVPNFRRSTVDGFAVRHEDLGGASESIPVILKRIEDVQMGKECLNTVSENECSYVPIGGMIPDGADGVVMIESTDVIEDDEVIFYSQVSLLQNVISIGEDVGIGEILLNKGKTITSYDIGVLTSVGITKVKVYEKINIGIISTGDEIVPYDEIPQKGQVRDVNSHLLISLLKKKNCSVSFYGIIKDSLESLKEALGNALNQCQIVIISGGSSLGERDFTIQAISSTENVDVLCHGLAIKPGKQTIIAKTGDKTIFGLPGNPLAVAFIYKSVVEKFIDFNNDKEDDVIDFVLAEFTINYNKARGREEFLPVQLRFKEGKIFADPIMVKSNVISCMAMADGYVSINKNLEGIHKGELIKVNRI